MSQLFLQIVVTLNNRKCPKTFWCSTSDIHRLLIVVISKQCFCLPFRPASSYWYIQSFFPWSFSHQIWGQSLLVFQVILQATCGWKWTEPKTLISNLRKCTSMIQAATPQNSMTLSSCLKYRYKAVGLFKMDQTRIIYYTPILLTGTHHVVW